MSKPKQGLSRVDFACLVIMFVAIQVLTLMQTWEMVQRFNALETQIEELHR